LTQAGVYSYFTNYTKQLLDNWVPKGGQPRPLVAFGVPVSGWLESTMLRGEPLGSPPQLVTIKLTSGFAVPTVTPHHPSMIFNTAHTQDNPNTPKDERELALIANMIDDMIAAEWQVRMVQSPSQPAATFSQCDAKWRSSGMQEEIKRLIEEQIRPLAATPAAKEVLDRVMARPKVVSEATYASDHQRGKASLDKLRARLGASDGNPTYTAQTATAI